MSPTEIWNIDTARSHNWKICPKCDGVGRKRQKPGRKAQQWYKKALMIYEKSWNIWPLPIQPQGHINTCDYCWGSGLIHSENPPSINTNYPHVAIIGGGIFTLTGIAAHDYAGPALALSFVIAGIGCLFASLCYAEFAAMVPVAGSAYTYAYATLGELAAWIIGCALTINLGKLNL